MKVASIRIITADIVRLVAFYERVTGAQAVWFTDDFAEVAVGSFTVAIGSEATVGLFAAGSARGAANRSVIVELLVDDVDAYRERLGDVLAEVVAEPTTMPWGNRSLLFRDPDGTLVNVFTPVTPAARAKFGV